MKICMLTSLHAPLDDRIFFKEAISLQKNGNEVSILCLSDAIGRIKDMSGKVLNPNLENEIMVVGIKITSVKKQNGLLQKMLHKLGMGVCWRDFIEKAILINADVYHAHEPQTAFFGLKIINRTKSKLIYDAHEPWIISRSIKEWVLKKITLSKLKNVIAANPITQKLLQKENPNLHTQVIYNCSPAFFGDVQPHRKGLIICHEGSLWFNRGLKLILEALVLLKKTHPSFLFKIVGEVYGAEKKYLQQKIKTYGLQDNFLITGWLPYQQVPDALSECSLGIICNTFKKRNTLAGPPNKLFNYMTMGLAIVSVDLPATTSIIKSTECGIVLKKRNAMHLAEQLRFLLDNKTLRERYQNNALIWAKKQYNWQEEERKLLQFYSELK